MKNILMKKIPILLLFFFSGVVNVDAEVVKFKTTSVSYMTHDDLTGWSDWSTWEPTEMLVVIDADRDLVTIYSENPQEFDVIDTIEENEYDNEGGTSTTFLVVDEDGLRCHLRFRVQSDNSLQLYIDYNDFRYVYNLEGR